MRFPLHIALRYLFSKKKHNAINIISGICAVGIALATTALVGVLSVYNGFQDLISQLFSSLDPDLKISLVEGKVFDSDMESIQKVKTLDFVKVASEVLEDNALARNENKQAAITLKGVDRGVVREMIVAWLLTFPFCTLLGFIFGFILMLFSLFMMR